MGDRVRCGVAHLMRPSWYPWSGREVKAKCKARWAISVETSSSVAVSSTCCSVGWGHPRGDPARVLGFNIFVPALNEAYTMTAYQIHGQVLVN